MGTEIKPSDDVDKLRLNSRVKHLILSDYLPTWASILGSWDKKLNYFDCFAGPGKYLWNGSLVDGSPIIAIKECAELLSSARANKPHTINLAFIEHNETNKKKLEAIIASIQNIPTGLRVTIHEDESESKIKGILTGTRHLAPSFFFIDPYEHPFSLKFMNEIMTHDKTEIMVNFMYYQIIRDIDNPIKGALCEIVEPDNTAELDLKTGDKFDDEKMLQYLGTRVGAKYYIPFRVHFGPDEGVDSNRLKYFLIHYSNSFKAFDLMLNIMWKHSEGNNPLIVSEGALLFPKKDDSELRDKLLCTYDNTGTQITFDNIVEKNWLFHFPTARFKAVLKQMETDGVIRVNRITSKTKRGLQGADTIIFM